MLAGVYANANTLEGCRDELAEVLEGWVLLGVSLHHPIPPVDGIGITVGQVARVAGPRPFHRSWRAKSG